MVLLRRLLWILGTCWTLTPTPAPAQTLSLADALNRARHDGFGGRGGAADVEVRAGQAALSLKGFLPAFRVETGFLRTTDPLGAFGALLREREVTAAAFAPNRLNHPDPISQFSSALILEQPLLNLDAVFGRQAARSEVGAAEARHRWLQSGDQLDVVRAYYGAILFAEQVGTLETAVAAALAHQRQAESMHRNGLVTASDELLAAVRVGDLQVQLSAARGGARLARVRLGVALGSPGDTAFSLPGRLPDSARIRVLVPAPAGLPQDSRGDVEAARLGLDAAAADQRRAATLLLPRLNSFGRLDWNSSSTPFGNQSAWTVGVMLSWSPFAGGSELAERRIAVARREGAAVQVQALEARASLELLQADIELEVALERMTIAAQSVEQSAEAHRIVTRKYDGGLATVVELLDAAAAETNARLALSDARFAAIRALAERFRAAGVDLMTLTSLESGE